MKFRYYTNEAGDIMSGVFRDDLAFSEEENLYADDLDMVRVRAEARNVPFMAGYWTGVLDLIYFGVVENDAELTRHLRKMGAFQ